MPDKSDEFGRDEKPTATPPKYRPRTKNPTALWEAIAKEITPQLLVQYINNADAGLISNQMELFDRMADRDSRLAAVLYTRKLGITGEDWEIVPAIEDDEKAAKAAEFLRSYLTTFDFEDTIEMLQDGVGKGLQAGEIVWNSDASISGIEEIPGKQLKWDKGVLLVNYGGSRWEPLEPAGRFIVHSPRTKPGYVERRGILRPLSILWVMKHWALKDWAAFAEVFGMPLRIGRYPDGASPEDIADLQDALEELGSDASATVPEGMDLSIVESKVHGTSGGQVPMQAIIDYVDKEYAITALGQNLTTSGESGTGTLAGGAHENVRRDYKKADAKSLAKTLRKDLFRFVILWNLGPDYPVPKIRWNLDDATDENARAKTYTDAQAAGLAISESQMREDLNLREPTDDDDILEAPISIGGGLFSKGRGPASIALEALAQTSRSNDRVGQAASDETGDSYEKEILAFVRKLGKGIETPEQLLRRIELAAPNIEELLEEEGHPLDSLADVYARAMITGDYNGGATSRTEVEKAKARAEAAKERES